MNRRQVLEAADAATIVSGADYGEPADCFTVVAALWSAIGLTCHNRKLEPRDVAIAMILLKVARQGFISKQDNWIDIAGYAACGAEVDAD